MAALTPRRLLALAAGVAVAARVDAATLRVPEDRPSVTAALASCAVGDTVLLAPGTYAESVTLPVGVTLRAADLSQPPVLDAGGGSTAVTSALGSASSRVEGITIRNGTNAGGPGGGIRVQGGRLALADVRIENCQAALGGALSLESGAQVTWTRGTATGCSASYGGAVFASGGTLTLTQVLLATNSAQTGGALFAQSTSPLNLVSCTMRGNQSGGDGGALALTQCGASLSDCRLDGNHATGNGGALWAGPGTEAVCGYTVFSNNQALEGGGAYATCDGPAAAGCSVVHFTHADLFRNAAASSGAMGAGGASRIETEASVIAFNSGGIACLDPRATIDIACTLLHANGADPFPGCASSVSDTTTADPLLCNLDGGDFERCAGSPALSPAACGTPFLGALGLGCAACASTPAKGVTWGGLKARYR